jgi:3-oxoacyl-[acyl-carrier protein] reductase
MTAIPSRAALVTGGTRGIGLGIAQALANAGWELALCGVRPASEVDEVVKGLRAKSGRVEYFQADLAQRSAREGLIAQIRSSFDVLNALVNNAGRAPRVRADLLNASEDSFEELIRTNLQGPYFLTQAIAADMVDYRRRDATFACAIVFITSVSAELASVNRGDYCMSKAGLAMAARLFAARLASDGIPVYEVRPGIIETDMTAAAKAVYDRRIADGLIPAGRWGQPADVGAVVAALLQQELPYSTGSVIQVDGGLSLPRL